MPWTERRGIVRCDFDRKSFRNYVLILVIVTVGFGLFLVVTGHGWGFVTIMVLLCGGVYGLLISWILASTARCVLEVDFDRSEFRLHRFVYPLSFWDFHRKPLVTVPFDEVSGVMRYAAKGSRVAYIGTRSSRFELSDYMQHFDRVVDLAEELAGPEGNAAMRRASALRIWVPCLIGGALVCLLAWIAIGLGWI